MSLETLQRRIRNYESFGVHRTGWPGDMASAAWAVSELASDGIEAEIEEFDFPKLNTRIASISWIRGSVCGVPLHDCGSTGPAGISGSLVMAGAEDTRGKIVMAEAGDPGYGQQAIYKRIPELLKSGAVGLVLLRCDSLGSITVLNAYRIAEPFQLPVLQIACKDSTELVEAATAGVEVRLTVDTNFEPGIANNVVITLEGEDREASPVAIMTPRSGWFTCASERGGGVAIWLGLATALASMPCRKRTVHMVASSGHEINHYGLQSYLAAREGLETSALAWLHLGALIGSRATSVKIEPSTPELYTLAKTAFESSGATRWNMWEQRGGEAENIAAAGGRYVSLRGGPSDGEHDDTFFHSPNDSIDRATDIELVVASGRACLQMVETLVAS